MIALETMKFFLFWLLVSLFKTSTANVKAYTENEIYINNATNYDDIPNECKLFGIGFPKHNLVSNIRLNITRETLFWIGARIDFPKKFNPLGGVRHTNSGNRDGNKYTTVEECASTCIDHTYFSFNNKSKSCTCLDNKESLVADPFERSNLCEQNEVFCHESGTVLYEKVISDTDYKCEVYTYAGHGEKWTFQFINCLEKKNYSFVCNNGELEKPTENISWYEAFQRCKERDYNRSELLRYPIKDVLCSLKQLFNSASSYWVSFLRRPRFIWGKDSTNMVCVAAKIQTNGSYSLESQLCSKKLEALCHRPVMSIINGSSKTVDIATASGSAAGVVVFLVGTVAVIYKKRRKNY